MCQNPFVPLIFTYIYVRVEFKEYVELFIGKKNLIYPSTLPCKVGKVGINNFNFFFTFCFLKKKKTMIRSIFDFPHI